MVKVSLFCLILVFKGLLLIFRMKNLLLILFAFEFLILKMFFMYVYLKTPSEMSSSLIFLAVAAGEASLGLSLLVAIVRNYGKDSGDKSKILNLCEGF